MLTSRTEQQVAPTSWQSLKPAIRKQLADCGAADIHFDGHSTHGQQDWRVTFRPPITNLLLLRRWLNRTLAPLGLKAAYVTETDPPFPIFTARIVRAQHGG